MRLTTTHFCKWYISVPVTLSLLSLLPSTTIAGNTNTKILSPPTAIQKKLITLYNNASKLLKHGKKAEALNTYHKIIALAGTGAAQKPIVMITYGQIYNIYSSEHNLNGVEAVLEKIAAIDPTDNNTASRLARLAALRHQSSLAVKWADSVLAHNPNMIERESAEMALGLVAANGGDDASAAVHFSKAVQEMPKDSDAHYNYAVALLHLKQFVPALKQANDASQLMPKSPLPLLLATEICQNASDLQEAQTYNNRALKLDPTNFTALFSRAYLYQQLLQTDPAISSYLEALKKYPNNPAGHYNLGILYVTKKQFGDAADQFRLAKGVFGKTNPIVEEQLAQALADEALSLEPGVSQNKVLGEAVSAYKEALIKDPKNQKLPVQLAVLYSRTGHMDEARAIYAGLLDKDKTDQTAAFGIANLDIMNRDGSGAEMVWKQFIKTNPSDSVAYQQLAFLQEAMTQWSDAIQTWKSLLQVEPQDGDAVLAMANDYVKSGNPTAASTYYHNILLMDPQAMDVPANKRLFAVSNRRSWRLTALQGLADIAQSTHHLHQAISWLEQAKREDATYEASNHQPVRMTPYREIASIYLQLKEPQKAIDELVNLTKALPLSAEPYSLLANIYEQQNDIPDAIASLKKASERAKSPINYSLELATLYRQHNMLPQAEDTYETLLKNAPDDQSLITNLAQTQQTAGELSQALLNYEKLAKLEPQSYWILDREAEILTIQKHYRQALVLRNRLIDVEPSDPQAYADQQHLYVLMGKQDEWFTLMQNKVLLYPSDAILLSALLDGYQTNGEESAGNAFMTSLATKNSSNSKVLEAISQAYQNHGDITRATQLLQQAAVLSPTDVTLHINLANLLDSQHQLVAANAIYSDLIANKVLSLQTRNKLRCDLAQRLSNQGKISEAILEYKSALNANPLDETAFHSLATLYNQQHMVQQMISLCSATYSLANASPVLQAEAHCIAGTGYQQQNNLAEAKSQFTTAVNEVPGYEPALAGLDSLKIVSKSKGSGE